MTYLGTGILSVFAPIFCGVIPGRFALCIADSTCFEACRQYEHEGIERHTSVSQTSTKRVLCLTVTDATAFRGIVP
jgi:hypothetical protein